MIGKIAFLLPLLALPLHAASPLSGKTIAIDPGHGTLNYRGQIINSGKANNDGRLNEHRLTFDMAQKLGSLIEKQGGRVIYTRSMQEYWRWGSSTTEDNKARALLANELKADAFVSIHCDWNPRSKMKGVTTYYKSANSRALADSVQRNLVKGLKTFDRRVKKDSYTVLDVATMPAILVETGFLSNRAEAKKLATTDYQAKVAQAIYTGLELAFAN